jgi:hypothetical protein
MRSLALLILHCIYDNLDYSKIIHFLKTKVYIRTILKLYKKGGLIMHTIADIIFLDYINNKKDIIASVNLCIDLCSYFVTNNMEITYFFNDFSQLKFDNFNLVLSEEIIDDYKLAYKNYAKHNKK